MCDNLKEEKVNERKFAWVDKWVAMTGARARIDAKVNNTCIVYETDEGLVQEYPNGEIELLNQVRRKSKTNEKGT